MGIESLLARRQSQTETPETPSKNQAFQLEATAGAACTRETRETPQSDKSQAARCVDCRNAEPVAWHPALATCAEGEPSGNPTGAWWITDSHRCGSFAALDGIYRAILDEWRAAR